MPASWSWGGDGFSENSCGQRLWRVPVTNHTRSPAGDATVVFVSWLVTGAVGPALVALPVNLAADRLAGAAVRWFKRFRQTDDLSRLVKAGAGTSAGLSRAEIKDLRGLLEEEDTWRQFGGCDVTHLTDRIAACLESRDDRTPEDSRAAAEAIARGLLEFAVFELEPQTFQKVALARLQQMTNQASALDSALFRMHKDLYHLVDVRKDLFQQVMDRLPPGPADLGEVRIYLETLIDWLNTDPWPRDLQLGGPVLTPAAIERKLRVRATGPAHERDADADELARQCNRLVILGGPGSGKTWLAKRTARICAEQAMEAIEAGTALDEVEMPLYTTCSRLISAPGTIREAAASSAIERIGDMGGSRIIKALRLFFTERDTRTLLIIDSLDEASDAGEARDRLREADSLRLPWRVVLTSRPISWNNQLTIDKDNRAHRVGELQPLRYPRDVDAVIGQWFAGMPEHAQALAAQIAGRPSLHQAATVPLILAFYCILGGQQPLPDFRHKLYTQIINRMLHSPWRPGSAPPTGLDDCRATLRKWAWSGAKNHPVSGIGQWEDDIPTRDAELSPAGLAAVNHIAVPRGGPDFDTGETSRRFVHRAIREHLVAEYVASLPVDHAVEELLPHLWYDPDWEYTAPAAIAMHPKHDEVLRALLCRANRSDEIPSSLSVIDAGGEVHKLLARIAAESKQNAWPPDLATIISRARIELMRPGDLDVLGEAVMWPTSDHQACGALLEWLARDTDSGTAIRLADSLARLDPTADDKYRARDALLKRLAREPDSLTAARLAALLAKLDPTADDKCMARGALLKRLARETDSPVAAWLAALLAQLDPAADDRRQTRGALLKRLARETDSRMAADLAALLAQLTITADDKHQDREALLTRLRDEADSLMAAVLGFRLTQLDPTADDKRRTRCALLERIARERKSFAADMLAEALMRLDPTADDRRQAREALLTRLAREINSDLSARLAFTLVRLDPTAADKHQTHGALLKKLVRETDSLMAAALVALLARLITTAADKRQARDALLKQLGVETDSNAAARLAFTLVRLDPAADDKRQARSALLKQLGVETDSLIAAALAETLARLDPTADDTRKARDALLEQLARETDSLTTAALAALLARLDPTADDRRKACGVLVERLVRETQAFAADRLVETLVRLDPTVDDMRRARDALLERPASEIGSNPATRLALLVQLTTTVDDRRLTRGALLEQLAHDTRGLRADWLAATLAGLDPTADDRRQARGVLVERLARETGRDTAAQLADTLVRLDPTADDRRQARDALLKQLARWTDSNTAARLADTLERLGPTADDRRRARDALLKQLAHETGSGTAARLYRMLAQFGPMARYLSTWPTWETPPTARLLGLARRNSPLEEWLSVLPSLSPLPP